MTLDELRIVAGAPSDPPQRRELGDGLDAAMWHEPMAGADGWWWAVVEGDLVHALGWTSGDHLDRDIEIGRVLCATTVRRRREATTWS